MTPTDRHRPRKQPKQQRSTITRERILDGAAQVFAEFGYGRGTTNRIAERAGVSIGTLYQYFPNKDSILTALSYLHLDSGSRLLAERLDDGLPDGIDDILRVFVRAMIDNHRDDLDLHRVLFEEAPRSPDLLTRLHETEEQAVGFTTALLAEHPDVSVTDPEIAARLVVATIESLVHRLITAPIPVDPAAIEHEVVTLLARYLRPAISDGGGR